MVPSYDLVQTGFIPHLGCVDHLLASFFDERLEIFEIIVQNYALRGRPKVVMIIVLGCVNEEHPTAGPMKRIAWRSSPDDLGKCIPVVLV